MNEFLKSILDGIYSVVGNYGWSIVFFTLLIRFVLLPFDYKSRKSMRKTQKLQPQIAALQKKYKNDKEKLNQKMAELYRKEKINPLSGCLPMLLSLPILFAMLGAMRMMSSEQIAGQVFTYLSGGTPTFQGWLWVHNIWMPDSPFATRVPDIASINGVISQSGWEIWRNIYSGLSPDILKTLPATITFNFADKAATTTTVAAMIDYMKTLPAYSGMLNTVPGWTNIQLLIVNLSVFQQYNGLFLLPILAAVTQYIMSIVTPQPVAQDGQAGQAASTNNFMKWFFPIFSIFICFSANAGFSLYWVTANVIAAVQNVVLNKYFDMQDKKAATVGEGTVK